MKIKSKLIVNAACVLFIVLAVSATSYLIMGFVRESLYDLTQRSTPYQMRSLEFQRAIQSVTADLVRIGSAQTAEELAGAEAGLPTSLAEVKESQAALENLMGGEKSKTFDELQKIADEVLAVSRARLKADREARAAKDGISRQLDTASGKIAELEAQINALQATASSSFVSSITNVASMTKNQEVVDWVLRTVKDLQVRLYEYRLAAEAVRPGMQEKLAGEAALIKNDAHIKAASHYLDPAKRIAAAVAELGKIKNGAKREERVISLLQDIDLDVSSLIALLESEVRSRSILTGLESQKQGELMTQANLSTGVLIAASQLLTQGMAVEGMTAKLFTLTSAKEIAPLEKNLKNAFGKIEASLTASKQGLEKLGEQTALKILTEVDKALKGIRTSLLAQSGVVEKIRDQLAMEEKTRTAMEDLRQVVVTEAKKSRETVTAARGEQEEAIGSVNQVVRVSSLAILAISLVAIVIGIFLGLWVYRSVSRPLGKLMEVTEEVAAGNLRAEIDVSARDEIGLVQAAMAKMVGNLREVVGRISQATSSLASSSEELSATAGVLDTGSKNQTQQVEQSATAMEEMSQTTVDMAKNATDTAAAAQKMKTTALAGRGDMVKTREDLTSFSVTFNNAAQKVEALGQKTEEVNSVLALIREIADQTNLLALNAAIEAAHAGDQGRGFAVVADNVRQLAERTSAATDDVAKTVRAMQSGTREAVSYIKNERESVKTILARIDTTVKSIDEIAGYVAGVADMVERIATATEQQSSTAEMVSRNMEEVAQVTRQLHTSVGEIKNTSDALSRLAHELNTTASWFKV
jgi:methyl-accepting chemotaxis protein